MASLADIRARLAEQETNTNTPKSDGAIYPHWNIDVGALATVRFLPDGDPENAFFWIERQIIKLPFNGIKGDTNSKHTTVQVPCVEMFGDNCPILAEVRPWYKDETLKAMAGKYWKKRTYIFQGFVRQNPIGEDETPANPIRRFIVAPQIFAGIKASLMDTEIEEMPTDSLRGLDFNIRKTQKGEYADYATSSWSRKETALTEAEQAAVDAHGLWDLKEFLPKKPSESELRVIKEMFEASVDGLPYDLEKWGAYYRPYGMQLPDQASKSDSAAPADPATPATPATPADPAPLPEAAIPQAASQAPAEPEANIQTPSAEPVKDPGTSSDKAQDILAMIRARQRTD